jgi:hypothetical protein
LKGIDDYIEIDKTRLKIWKREHEALLNWWKSHVLKNSIMHSLQSSVLRLVRFVLHVAIWAQARLPMKAYQAPFCRPHLKFANSTWRQQLKNEKTGK